MATSVTQEMLALDRPIQVVALAGSLRENSLTRAALRIALSGARATSAQTRLLDLNEYDLPFADGRDDESTYPPGVFRLREDVKAAQGIIIGTPEYHGSYTGVLKNALDLLGFDEFEGKIVGLVGVSAGKMGAVSALDGLRGIGRSLHAWVIPEQVSIAEVERVITEDGTIQNPRIEGRLRELGRQVARFAYLHTANKPLEFLRQWETAPENPGGA